MLDLHFGLVFLHSWSKSEGFCVTLLHGQFCPFQMHFEQTFWRSREIYRWESSTTHPSLMKLKKKRQNLATQHGKFANKIHLWILDGGPCWSFCVQPQKSTKNWLPQRSSASFLRCSKAAWTSAVRVVFSNPKVLWFPRNLQQDLLKRPLWALKLQMGYRARAFSGWERPPKGARGTNKEVCWIEPVEYVLDYYNSLTLSMIVSVSSFSGFSLNNLNNRLLWGPSTTGAMAPTSGLRTLQWTHFFNELWLFQEEYYGIPICLRHSFCFSNNHVMVESWLWWWKWWR